MFEFAGHPSAIQQQIYKHYIYIYVYVCIIVVSRNCFCICQNISAHFGFSIFSILTDIKKPPRILAIGTNNSNNFVYNFGY